MCFFACSAALLAERQKAGGRSRPAISLSGEHAQPVKVVFSNFKLPRRVVEPELDVPGGRVEEEDGAISWRLPDNEGLDLLDIP